MAEPQQAYLGKSNMPNQPAMLPTATTRKSNEKSARSLRQPKKCNQIIKKNQRERESRRDNIAAKKVKQQGTTKGWTRNVVEGQPTVRGRGRGQLQFAACLKWKIPATWNSKRCIPLAAIVGSYCCCCCCSCKCNKQNVLIIKIVKAKEMARYNDWLQQWAVYGVTPSRSTQNPNPNPSWNEAYRAVAVGLLGAHKWNFISALLPAPVRHLLQLLLFFLRLRCGEEGEGEGVAWRTTETDPMAHAEARHANHFIAFICVHFPIVR